VSAGQASWQHSERGRFGTIVRLAEVDSTNRYLLDEARGGASDGLVVVADRQTAGRGRLGRSWESGSGSSLLVSVLLRTEGHPVDRHVPVMTAAVAMADAVEATTGVVPSVKWPNDLLVGEKKLAGILAEATGDAVVVGVGVNLDWQSVPPELAFATACNLEGGRPTTRDEVLDAFLHRYAALLDDPVAARAEYVDRLSTLGRTVRVELEGDVIVGLATGIDETGRLVVEPDGGAPVVLAAGDVVHLRGA
jgi:BirA family biotin operon repressor/biotin-[acetyl-CoA-carboxylase] ligase